MDDRNEQLFYLGGGPLAAILLGMAFVPLRDFTTASNFTFAFLALTIAVAEFGGRWPAVATALCSALSLDFFLTNRSAGSTCGATANARAPARGGRFST